MVDFIYTAKTNLNKSTKRYIYIHILKMSLRPREIYFEDSWHSLLEIIRGVVTVNRLRKIDKPLWHNTFSDVYMLCVAHPEPHSKQLYDETKKLLESHISEIYQVSLPVDIFD